MTGAAAHLEIPTPRWAVPLLQPAAYKGAHGGRGGGKSHFFAELIVEEAIADPNLSAVCIREIQRSLRFSSKRLIESKIRHFGAEHYFEITREEIRRVGGEGVIIFQGMQDHTAESIKSLEGFRIAWAEEAQSLSNRSLELLLPTIREEDSEIWFSWNPQYETDPVDRLMRGDQLDAENTICVHSSYLTNPFVTRKTLEEAQRHKRTNPETFDHVWLGDYIRLSDAIILAGRWRVEAFEPGGDWDGPYHGVDWGFANDPTAGVRVWVHDGRLWIEREAGRTKLDLDDTAEYLERGIPGISRYTIRSDSARPETISHLRRHPNEAKRLPNVVGVKKWQGSVEDGIEHIKSYAEIVVHPRCEQWQAEARRYQYKIDRRTQDVLPVPVDAYNHFIDATRYALEPRIRRRTWTLV